MIVTNKQMKGLVVQARDGELGTVDQLFFDDERWVVRYLTVVTGNWLDGKQVLVSPLSVKAVDWQSNRLEVFLSRKQVQDSPDIDMHKPVSRQHETDYLSYYGYPAYWGGNNIWGPSTYPGDLLTQRLEMRPFSAGDSHLRSSVAVNGYCIEAVDGEIGHVDGFLVDDRTWSIRYVEVATGSWFPGKKVLISPSWIRQVSWERASVSTLLSCEAIQSAPAYTESRAVTRVYEDKLFMHYGLPPYWLSEAGYAPAAAVTI